MRELQKVRFHELKVDMSQFVAGMNQIMEGVREVNKTLKRNAEARRTITTSYAPPPFEGIDI